MLAPSPQVPTQALRRSQQGKLSGPFCTLWPIACRRETKGSLASEPPLSERWTEMEKNVQLVFFWRKGALKSQALIECLIVRELCGKLPCFPQMLKEPEPEFRKNVFLHIHPCPRGCDGVGKCHSGQVRLWQPHRNKRIHKI